MKPSSSLLDVMLSSRETNQIIKKTRGIKRQQFNIFITLRIRHMVHYISVRIVKY